MKFLIITLISYQAMASEVKQQTAVELPKISVQKELYPQNPFYENFVEDLFRVILSN